MTGKGLGSLPAACRDFLRTAFASGESLPSPGTHAAVCGYCRDRVTVARVLGAAVKQAPPQAPGLASRATVEQVVDRVIERSEDSPLGRALAEAMPVEPIAEVAEIPPGLLQSSLTERLVASRQPAGGGLEQDWQAVQASIYDRVLADSASRRRYWPWGAAGAAAAAVFLMMILHEGTLQPQDIVFTDLQVMPNVDFAILRYGPPR